MMYSLKHKIKSQVLDITFQDESKANALYEALKSLCERELKHSMDKCFSEFSAGETLIQFDTVEVDLGDIEYAELPSLAQRAYDALKIILADKLSRVAQPSSDVKISAAPMMDVVRHFLRYGYLPWNASGRELASILHHCLENSAGTLGQMIREAGTAQVVRERLTTRFNDEMLRRIVTMLEPQHGDVILAYRAHLIMLNARETIIKATQGALGKVLWLFVFNHLLVEQRSIFNTKSFVKSMLRQFAAHYNLSFVELVTLILQGLKRWEGAYPPPCFAIFQEVCVELSLQTPGHDDAQAGADATSADAILSLFITYLQSGDTDRKYRSGEQAALRVKFSQVLDEFPDHSVAQLKQVKNRLTAVRRLVTHFGKEFPRRVVKAIEPGEFETIIEYHKSFITLHKNDPITMAPQKELEQKLWEFIILNILDNHGSYFNQKSFLKTLLQDTATHYNLPVQALLDKMYRSARSLPTRVARINTFFKIVTEIFEETNKDAEVSGQTLQVAKTFHKEDLETRAGNILRAWKDTTSQDESDDASVLLAFLRRSPAQALDLFKKYLRYDPVRERAIHRFNNAAFRELIQVLQLNRFGRVEQVLSCCDELRTDLFPYFKEHKAYEQSVKAALLETVVLSFQRDVNDHAFVRNVMEKLARKGRALSMAKLVNLAAGKRSFRVPLFKTLREWEKGKEIQSKRKNNYGNPALIARLIAHAGDDTGLNRDYGFGSYTEAFGHVMQYHAEDFRKTLRNVPAAQVDRFLNGLHDVDLDLLLKAEEKTEVTWASSLLHAWSIRLKGFHKHDALMAALKRVVILQFITDEHYFNEQFLVVLSDTFIRYAVPASFFEDINEWSLPLKGDTAAAIRKMEQRVLHPQPKRSKGISKDEQARVLKESIRRMVKRPVKRPEEARDKPLMEGHEIYLSNAGLVLLHPYLSFLFEQCGYFAKGKFRSVHMQQRAVALLHYAGFGNTAYHEEDVVLNKLLCGLALTTVSKKIRLKKSEQDLVHGMFNAIISHWSIIRNTSIDGFRGNWLFREGKLNALDNDWELTVERKTFDLLLDQLPFTLSPVKLSWMNNMIKVNWR